MTIAESLLPEFDMEMTTTRKTLEAVPTEKFAFTPHEKSMPMGKLANHVAELPTFASLTIQTDTLDIAPVDGPPYAPSDLQTQEELLAFFDKNVLEARAALAGASDEALHADWSFAAGGEILMTMPRIASIRTWTMNHLIHHRAQLGVYLRLNDIPVPKVYGPTADDPTM
jgi:uncharacterized damage-inducible protein DinB